MDVKLNRIETVLSEVEYPATRESLAEEFDDVTLKLSEGEVNLGDLVARSNDDSFDSMEDLTSEIMSLLPRHAVGEPYQSEGEG